MVWLNIVLGAACGAVAALIVGLFGSRSKSPLARGIGLLLFAILFALAREFVAPPIRGWIAANQLEESLASNPVFAALSRYEPAVYQQMIAHGKESLRSNVPVQEVSAGLRGTHVIPLVAQRLPKAEDGPVIKYLEANMQEVRELLSGGDDACYRFMFPESGPPMDFAARISKETLQRDLAALAAVIESAATRPQTPPNAKDVDRLLEPISQRLQQRFGDDLALMNSPQATTSKRRRVCEIVLDMYSQVFALPAKDSGQVARSLFTQ